MTKKAFNVLYRVPGYSHLDIAIIRVPDGKKDDSNWEEECIKFAIAEKNGCDMKRVEIIDYSKRDLSTIKLSEITIEDFANLFDLQGRL